MASVILNTPVADNVLLDATNFNGMVSTATVSAVGANNGDIDASAIATGDVFKTIAGSATTGPSLRSLGTGQYQATAGNDPRILAPLNVYNVKSYGATGDGVTDDTAAIQATINAASGAPAATVYFPDGQYSCGQVNIIHGLVIQGAGRRWEGDTTGTRIVPNSAGLGVLFYVNTISPCTFRDFTISGQPQLSGAAIQLDFTAATSTGNLFTLIENVLFDLCYNGVQAIRASSWSVVNCQFWNIQANGSGIFIDNIFNRDQGDQCITGNTFAPSVFGNSAAGITWQGGGGTRVENNKFFTANGFIANLSTGTNTGQLYIIGNSFDNTTIGINMFQLSGTATVDNIVICDNQILGYGVNPEFIYLAGIASATISNVLIANNMITEVGGSVTNGGIVLAGYVNNFKITGNHLVGNSGGNGILINPNNTNGNCLGNFFSGWSTNIANSSTGIAITSCQTGDVTATTGTSFAGYFSTSAQVVTFPIPFIVAPAVTANADYASNSALFVMINGVTTTGFSMIIVAKDNATSVTAHWTAVIPQ